MYFRPSESQIIEQLDARPPWDEVNRLLGKYGFTYQINRPEIGMKYIPSFTAEASEQPINFSQLSSGEKVLVTLVLWAFNARAKLHKELFLLDEFDAHLNPALSKMMIEVIEGQLVDEFGLEPKARKIQRAISNKICL